MVPECYCYDTTAGGRYTQGLTKLYAGGNGPSALRALLTSPFGCMQALKYPSCVAVCTTFRVPLFA